TQEPVPSLKRRRPSLPSLVERAILHALEKSPLKRTQTVHEFADELEVAVNADPSISPEHLQPPPVQSNLVPVVKQVSGQISIVEYMVKSDVPESANPLFSSGQFKHPSYIDKLKEDAKTNWPYMLIGIILLLSLIIIIAL